MTTKNKTAPAPETLSEAQRTAHKDEAIRLIVRAAGRISQAVPAKYADTALGYIDYHSLLLDLAGAAGHASLSYEFADRIRAKPGDEEHHDVAAYVVWTLEEEHQKNLRRIKLNSPKRTQMDAKNAIFRMIADVLQRLVYGGTSDSVTVWRVQDTFIVAAHYVSRFGNDATSDLIEYAINSLRDTMEQGGYIHGYRIASNGGS